MSSPLDKIEAAAKSQADGSGHVWDVLARDVLALVAVARAAERRRDAQIDATHYHQYDPACPCCIAQDEEWAALSRLGKDTLAEVAT